MVTRPFLALAAALLALPSPALAQQYDLVLRNGRVVDGTGNPGYRADVALRGDEIVDVAPSIAGAAARVIDVDGQVIAPGFIDIHTHARRGIFDVPTADNYLRQGVTTLIEGNDGSSPLPLAPFFDRLEKLPRTVNIGSFIGQGSVREAVVGYENRAATAAELQRMRFLVEEGMRDGALGMSTGLFYVPGSFTPTEEVIALARVVAGLGGIHISHMRDESSRVVESVEETIRIGEEGGLPTQVTHHKVVGPGYWGASVETLALIDAARARGVDVTIDQYPYTASSTSLQSALMPAWALDGGVYGIVRRLHDPEARARIKTDMERILAFERGGGAAENVVIAHCEWNPTLDGKSLADVARMRGLEPTVENGAEAALSILDVGDCQAVFHAMDEGDLRRIMRHPATMIASDGNVVVFGEGQPHPRSYGSFARVLSLYVREEGVLSLEEAIRKMTSAPAQRLGMLDRGLVRPGMKADLVVFDPDRVRDLATFQSPHRYAEGFSLVIVNGAVVLEGDRITSARPGRVLYGPARR